MVGPQGEDTSTAAGPLGGRPRVWADILGKLMRLAGCIFKSREKKATFSSGKLIAMRKSPA